MAFLNYDGSTVNSDYSGDWSDDNDSSTDTSTDWSEPVDEFETGENTLGTDWFGADTGDDDPVTVIDTSDPEESSPAGGSGTQDAVERFTGIDEETLDDYEESGGDLLDVSQSASDYITEWNRTHDTDRPATTIWETEHPEVLETDSGDSTTDDPQNEPAPSTTSSTDSAKALAAVGLLAVGAVALGGKQ